MIDKQYVHLHTPATVFGLNTHAMKDGYHYFIGLEVNEALYAEIKRALIEMLNLAHDKQAKPMHRTFTLNLRGLSDRFQINSEEIYYAFHRNINPLQYDNDLKKLYPLTCIYILNNTSKTALTNYFEEKSMPINYGDLNFKHSKPKVEAPQFVAHASVTTALPHRVDLTPSFPCYDQGNIGSCTANALAAAIEFDRIKFNENPPFVPSRLFIYYNERQIENDVADDAGANLSDGIKALASLGVCSEALWPYVDTAADSHEQFPTGSKPRTKPSDDAYANAKEYIITSYHSVAQNLTALKSALASGFPFVFGITVFNSWLSTNPLPTTVPLPTTDDQEAGGHAIICVGYDDDTKLFKFRNSWGTEVGEKGYFYLPYEYAVDPNLASDFWVINSVKN